LENIAASHANIQELETHRPASVVMQISRIAAAWQALFYKTGRQLEVHVDA
jgi:hypothetical protein